MIREEFKTKGYVYLKNVLDRNICDQLVNGLKSLVKNEKTTNDDQCPLSEAIYGVPAFDKLLEDLTPYFEDVSGLKLFPTYAYARLYNKQNEELKIHRDRPSCEISATLTLGFDGNVWSIYMGANEDKSEATKIDMEIGDAVMYRGMDIWHWRESYVQGKWQAQVFLHYVDQNGPHAEWKYDKRPCLSHHLHNDILSEFYYVENAVSDGFCDKLIEEYSKKEVEKEPPYIGENNRIDITVRNVQRLKLPLNQGIGATLTTIGLNTNHERWKYNITHSNQAEFLMYEPGGRYTPHTDTVHQHSNETRKLTLLLILNDDFEGGKFFIQAGKERFYPPQKKGTVIVFPSFILHGVEDITKGIRYSVVNWLAGPYFK